MSIRGTHPSSSSLLGLEPATVLSHGPTKLLVDRYLWYAPHLGAISCYTPTETDVRDHFGLFRGVDQVESFAQGTLASCCSLMEADKQGKTLAQIKEDFNSVFLEIGRVIFHKTLSVGETFIAVGQITFYKFRQMSMNGKIFKVPPLIDLDAFFAQFTDEDFTSYNLAPEFELVTELQGIVGKAVKINQLKQ